MSPSPPPPLREVPGLLALAAGISCGSTGLLALAAGRQLLQQQWGGGAAGGTSGASSAKTWCPTTPHQHQQRMGLRVGPKYNLRKWCEANGRQDLLQEWDDPSKEPEDVGRSSMQKAWWKCRKVECGHKWLARIGNRTLRRPRGCPGCAGSVPTATNNFEVWCRGNGREALLEEWDDAGCTGPKDVAPGSEGTVCWKCGNAGCRGPMNFTPGSLVQMCWKCRECGHAWTARIDNRTRRPHSTGCPGCAGSVPTPTNNFEVWCTGNGREDLLEEWDDAGSRGPNDVAPRSNVKVGWKCGKCGHAWVAKVADRTDGSHPAGCPVPACHRTSTRSIAS